MKPIPRIPRGYPLYGRLRAEVANILAEHYRAGMNQNELAEATGRSRGFVWKLLREAHEQARPRHPKEKK